MPKTFCVVGHDARQQAAARVLRRAVGWYAENRVLLDGDRTIIFK